jgi:hypothetical protein
VFRRLKTLWSLCFGTDLETLLLLVEYRKSLRPFLFEITKALQDEKISFKESGQLVKALYAFIKEAKKQ